MEDKMRLDNRSKDNSEGKIIGLLVAAFYGLFTLLPDSNTQVVTWPWVFLWQVGLLCPVIWLLCQLWQQQKIQILSHKFDVIAGLVIITLILSSAIATFPNQARWYAWAALCFVAALYALNNWLAGATQRRYQLLVAQGYLNLAFIVLSLGLWTSQILLPELNRLNQIRQQYGVNIPFDFSTVELRNGFPIGHQNYVAGYLVLAIPLLIGLSIVQTGWRRWLWVVGVVLGLINLYSTSSRGGWLGLIVFIIASFIILLLRSDLPRRWLSLGGIGVLAGLTLLVLANNRLNTLISGVFTGSSGGGELAYRTITATTGWKIGSSHLAFGAAPGSVPILYQQYRPIWAGREAELAYQLHSTPAHLWAELGILGITTLISAIALLLYSGVKWIRAESTTPRSDQIFVWSIYGGLLAYGITSITDYQIDNICISGTLIIFIAVLATIFRSKLAIAPRQLTPQTSLGLTLGGLGIVLAVGIWLFPIHYAWNLSSIGFANLSAQEVTKEPQQKSKLTAAFIENLTKSHQLAPWEPYYLYQLGWNLGDLGLQTTDPAQRQALLTAAIDWFKKGNQASPYQEFGHTNLAWLFMFAGDPQAASQEFARSAQLFPAKRGVFYGLGLSLLAQGKNDLAVEAITLEALREPLIITSPAWQSPQLQPTYHQVSDRLEAKYTTLLQQPSTLTSYWQTCRGGLRWWQGKFKAAQSDWEISQNSLGLQVLELAAGKTISPQASNNGAIAAWLDPANRQMLLQQAWISATRTIPPPQLIQEFMTGMANSKSLDQWLKQNAPTQQYRRSRAGFGPLSRHNDGPAPVDFLPVVENAAITNLFQTLLPATLYNPDLDLALQQWRNLLLKNIAEFE